MDTTRTTFLKKRLVSTAFDEVEVRFLCLAGDRGLIAGARGGAPRPGSGAEVG
jgi:hypothetical protein